MKNTTFFSSLKSLAWIIPFLSFLMGYFILDRLFRTEELETPALIGLNMQQAIALLSSKNLNLRILATKEDAMLDPGTIISQSPNQSQKIKENQSVYVVVINKPQQLIAPNIINKSLSEIQEEVASKKIRAKYYHLSSPYPHGTCFAQYPGPSQTLDESKKMIVYISKGNNKPVIVPNFKGKIVTDVIDSLENKSAQVEVFHYPPIPEHTCTCIVTDQRPMAGSIITPNPEKKLQIQLQVRPQE